MCRERLIEKVKKLLSLAENNSNQQESESAYLKAQELIAENDLTMSDIERVELNKQDVESVGVESSAREYWWHGRLALVIADNSKCKCFINKSHKSYAIQFMGFKNDVEIAKTIYTHAVKTLDVLADRDYLPQRIRATMKGENFTKNHYKPYRNTFIDGFIIGLREKFEEQSKQNEWGLILVTPEKVQKKYDSMKLKSNRSSVKKDYGNGAYDKGFKHGKNYSHISGKLTD